MPRSSRFALFVLLISALILAGLAGSQPRGVGAVHVADLAIDHFAVPLSSSREFATATKASDTFGSDHFPILTVWNR